MAASRISFTRRDLRSPAAAGRSIRAMKLEPDQLPVALRAARGVSTTHADHLVRGVLSTARTKRRYLEETKALFTWARTGTPTDRKSVLRALHEDRGAAGDLIAVQHISAMTRTHARAFMKNYFAVGGEVGSVAVWLRLAGRVIRKSGVKRRGTAGAVVDAIGDAADWVIDTLEDGVDAILQAVESIVDAVLQAGVSLALIFYSVAKWTVGQVTELLGALLEAGVMLGEIIGNMAKLAYKACEAFVQAMLDLGKSVVEILAEVVDVTYWHLRRIIDGLMKALGPIGDILDWAWNLAADAADYIWHKVLSAIRYAHGLLSDALEWAAEKGAEAMEAVLRAWEEIGEDLLDVYRWAADQAEAVWAYIGEATARIGNSIYYVLDYLKEDFFPGIFDFVRGLVKAGLAVADLIVWAVGQLASITYEVVAALLDMGVTLAQLVVTVVTHPTEAFAAMMSALDQFGATLSDLYDSVIVETGEQFLEELTLALHKIGKAAKDIFLAVAEVATGAFWTVCAVLLNTLSTYRPMTADEIAEAKLVFGNVLPYSKIWFSRESVVNDILSGIQDTFAGDPNSRAYTTNTLVNFDPDDGPLARHTMIHELTHVWQSLETGPFYMMEAIYAQNTAANYNYGYNAGGATITLPIDYSGTTDTFREGEVTGLNGEAALANAGGDFEEFNREQQGQIIMHYYVRRHLLAQSRSAWTPWLQYAQVINAALT